MVYTHTPTHTHTAAAAAAAAATQALVKWRKSAVGARPGGSSTGSNNADKRKTHGASPRGLCSVSARRAARRTRPFLDNHLCDSSRLLIPLCSPFPLFIYLACLYFTPGLAYLSSRRPRPLHVPSWISSCSSPQLILWTC